MRACDRLLNYVKYHTTSDPSSETSPSTARQFAFAEALAAELRGLGLSDVRVSPDCYVYAVLPAAPGHEDAPGLGFISHMDTSPDAGGENVTPLVHEQYDGRALRLPKGGVILSPEKFPFLARLRGQTLITADGSTLLGADDKAGIAEIMTALERIIAGDLPHGRLCIAFTPDEEIGRGTEHFDLEGFGAAYAYTVDGSEAGEIEYENFNAASAVVTVRGRAIHPGSAKDLMLNAQNVAWEFHAALPEFDRPEHTEGREGFFHLTSMMGDVTMAKLGYIIRDHDGESFARRKFLMRHIAGRLNEKYGPGTVTLELKDSYHNMIEQIRPHFHLVENARKAIRAAGLEPIELPIRGGTDGAMLSYRGLPCPNLGTGGFNFHGPYECITAEKMDAVVKVLVGLAALYA